MKPEDQGTLMFLTLCCGPWVAGVAVGFWYRGRFERHGALGALLPQWARELLGF